MVHDSRASSFGPVAVSLSNGSTLTHDGYSRLRHQILLWLGCLDTGTALFNIESPNTWYFPLPAALTMLFIVTAGLRDRAGLARLRRSRQWSAAGDLLSLGWSLDLDVFR